MKIECRTGAVGHELIAPVKVGNDAGFTESSVQFQYKDVRLEGLLPSQGPQSGGTQLSILGRYLNIGSSITAYLDDYECAINVTQASSTRLTCVTSAARNPDRIRALTLSIDGANRTFNCQPPPITVSIGQQQRRKNAAANVANVCSVYNYTSDPRIMQIKPLKSFASGGRMVTVHGTNLDAIQKPEIEVYDEDMVRVNKSVCSVISSNQMECPSPAVSSRFAEFVRRLEEDEPLVGQSSPSIRNRRRVLRSADSSPSHFTTSGYYYSSPPSSVTTDVAALKIREPQLSLQLSFAMDNVQSVRDLPKQFQSLRSVMVYVQDPHFLPFTGGLKLYKGDTLVIEGERLNVASDETDVNVTIGTQPCNVTSLAFTQLVCTPPDTQPAATDENGVDTPEDLPLVVVRVGRTLRFSVGYLKYDLLKPYAFSHALAGVAVAVAIIVVVLVVILVVYRRKSTQAEREYRRIQIQMDTLESNVRMECKQAFAELQTDMTDLTADLENSGIPTLDHVNYIMKVFFPGVSDHPILNSPKVCLSYLVFPILFLTQFFYSVNADAHECTAHQLRYSDGPVRAADKQQVLFAHLY